MPANGKRARTISLEKSEEEQSMNKAKKLKLLASHTLVSPFPNFTHPTRSETFEIHRILSEEHPSIVTTHRAPSASNNSAKTCGSVPNVLESLIGTILSQNTSARNSTAAKRNLDEVFGKNNFEVIATAPKADVVEAIRSGGLANKKADVIQKILKEVKKRHGTYSLQHLAGMVEDSKVNDVKGKVKPISNEEAMQELVSFEGVGPKTASCVLLFCLGRSSFPVDTHVFRLSRLLGWVPPKADRVTAQAHLDLMIPGELKYGLHVLMVGHGRRCKGCKAGPGAKGDCVLKTWLKEQKGFKTEDVEDAVLEADVEMKRELA